jgi:hypothetical protein
MRHRLVAVTRKEYASLREVALVPVALTVEHFMAGAAARAETPTKGVEYRIHNREQLRGSMRGKRASSKDLILEVLQPFSPSKRQSRH